MKISIVFTFDRKFCPPAYIAISSLIDSAKETTQYDIIIYYWDIGKKDLQQFDELIKGTRHTISYIEARKDDFAGYPVTRTWSYAVYLRLMLPDVLKLYDKVIYSDVDVFFVDDLSELYSQDLTGYEWGGVRAEINGTLGQKHQYYEEYAHKYIYWSGLMLMNLKVMREHGFSDKVKDCVMKYKFRLRMFDLEVLNLISKDVLDLPLRYIMLQSIYNNADIKKAEEYSYLSQIYSDEEILCEKQNTVIIHYAGKMGKPWLVKKAPGYYEEYMKRMPKRFWEKNTINFYEHRAVMFLKKMKRWFQFYK